MPTKNLSVRSTCRSRTTRLSCPLSPSTRPCSRKTIPSPSTTNSFSTCLTPRGSTLRNSKIGSTDKPKAWGKNCNKNAMKYRDSKSITKSRFSDSMKNWDRPKISSGKRRTTTSSKWTDLTCPPTWLIYDHLRRTASTGPTEPAKQLTGLSTSLRSATVLGSPPRYEPIKTTRTTRRRSWKWPSKHWTRPTKIWGKGRWRSQCCKRGRASSAKMGFDSYLYFNI